MKDSPAVVGELVACPFCGKSVATLSNTDELSGRPDVAFMYTVVCDAHRGGCGATVGYEPDQADAIASWNRRATLSALTAEAGKGEVTDAMVEAGCLAVVTVSGFKPENWPHTYPDAGQLRKAVRAALEAALSTATPAGEWREIDPFLDEAINGAVSDLDMIAAGVDPVTGDKLTHAAVQAIARASAITLNEAWTLAASPRGAGESGHD